MSATQQARSRGAGLVAAADWLSLAAAPSFAAMAVLAGIPGGHQLDALCAASPGGLSMGGMMPMYALMSTLHLAPWFKLLAKGCACGRV